MPDFWGVAFLSRRRRDPGIRLVGRAGQRSAADAAQHARTDVLQSGRDRLAVLAARRDAGQYPPGARVDLGLKNSPSTLAQLALKATGGVPPFTWLVNGAPIASPELRRDAAWTPDGAGFARVSVMDAKGSTDSVLVRLE